MELRARRSERSAHKAGLFTPEEEEEEMGEQQA